MAEIGDAKEETVRETKMTQDQFVKNALEMFTNRYKDNMVCTSMISAVVRRNRWCRA